MKKNILISKSKYVAGLQCIKYFWYLINNPEAIPPFDEVTQFRFQQGHDVGNLAKSLFPGGVEIAHGIDIEAELVRTRELTNLLSPAGDAANTSTRYPLFEPVFTYKNAFARADILEPSGTDAWNIIEVKSASSIKDINKHDISFQKYCYEGAGLKIDKCYLMYLNRSFIKNGPIDPHKFFAMDDVTAEAELYKANVEQNINIMLKVMGSVSCPEISIGKNCYNPYDCPLKQVCWSCLPENNVFELYRGMDLACYFYQSGITLIKDIPEDYNLSFAQKIQIECEKISSPRIDTEPITKFLDKFEYPLYFLDFETFATAIPMHDGTRPYQNIPFQFSLHVLNSLESEPQYYSFLAEGKGDPRKDLIDSLKDIIGDKGSIVVYYEAFEKNILKQVAELLPEYSMWIYSIIDRIIDLYEPFGNFHYYNPQQKGSASLKRLLPIFSSKRLDYLKIKNGQTACVYYLYIINNITNNARELKKHEIDKIKNALEEYCRLDAEGSIDIYVNLVKLEDKSSRLKKPIIFTEGKTDWMILKRAQDKLNIDLNLAFHESDKDLGCDKLLELCKNTSFLPHEYPITFIFDRDIIKIIKEADNEKDGFKTWGNNVFSIVLPIPFHRKDYSYIPIEMYFNDNEIKTKDNKNKRLFFTNEVEMTISPSNQEFLGYRKARVRKDEEYQKRILVKNIDKLRDSSGKSIAISKSRFAENIYRGIEPFNKFNYKEFQKIFSLIKKIIDKS